jgi:glycosyltransferase involved in cell wall biosynthesis
MPAVLGAADALCLVSDYEALPFVVLEAMASQLPVIATPVGALPEVVVPGETGLLTLPDGIDSLVDALLLLTSDRDQRLRLGRAGRERQIQLYAAEAMVDSYRDTLANMV